MERGREGGGWEGSVRKEGRGVGEEEGGGKEGRREGWRAWWKGIRWQRGGRVRPGEEGGRVGGRAAGRGATPGRLQEKPRGGVSDGGPMRDRREGKGEGEGLWREALPWMAARAQSARPRGWATREG